MSASIASSTAIDLSRLPPPTLVEQLDFEAILAALRADLLQRWPEFSATVESDPVQKLLEVSAYRELLLRAQFNERARGALIAYAAGPDLDHLAALFGVERLVITPANAQTGAAAVLEGDEALRRRVLLAPDAFSVAGPASAYVFHALSASGAVLDASAISPAPGDVLVTILARAGDGTAPAPLVAAVAAALDADTVRPLTDRVTVQSASVTGFVVTAQLWLFPGPDANLIRDTAVAALGDYLASARRLGRDVPRSAIIAALHVAGVQRVVLTAPAADLVFDATATGFATAVNVTVEGTGE